MDWQIIVMAALSLSALLGFFALGPEPRQPAKAPSRRRDSAAIAPLRAAPATAASQGLPADPEISARFARALQALQ